MAVREFVYLALTALAVVYSLMHVICRVNRSKNINNPTFVNFQKKYFVAYFLALLADWLQGPYLYKLYSHYGFLEPQIAILYVCGFAASVVFGVFTHTLADRYGRKKLCITFCIVYSVSCFTKLSTSYTVLIFGRILGGISTSLLFTAFEAWYVHEHVETHDFPKEWLSLTFSTASFWNGVLAISAGIVANIFAGVFALGPVSPFILAIPFLFASGAIVAISWGENYGENKRSFSKTCSEGAKNIGGSKRIVLIGAMQSLFESVMYIFIFIWTPVLDPHHPPLGLVFSSFMICIMIGTTFYNYIASFTQAASLFVNGSIVLALISTVICIGSTKPGDEHPTISYVAFLLLEFACGMYFPAMGFLRGRILPEAHTVGIMNWFRLPLNLIACIGLMVLHGDPSTSGTRHMFIICSCLLGLALFCGIRFAALTKDDENLKNPSTEETI